MRGFRGRGRSTPVPACSSPFFIGFRSVCRAYELPASFPVTGTRSIRRTVLWIQHGVRADLPRVTDAVLKLDLPCLHKRRVAFLGDLHRSVSKEQRNLVDGHTCKQHLNGEGVPEHVGMAALRRAISLSQVDQFEEAAIAALPIGNDALRLPIATPEKVTWIRLRTGRNILESLDHLWRERHIDRMRLTNAPVRSSQSVMDLLHGRRVWSWSSST